MTVAEHLEMFALGERIARYYRHPSQVDHAVKAGASWAQIAAATGTTENAARAAYREWADGQHRLHAEMGIGLDDDEYAAAIKAAGGPHEAPLPPARPRTSGASTRSAAYSIASTGSLTIPAGA